MLIEIGSCSHVGMVRDKNEDSYFCDETFVVIADGMGGHNKGEVASKMVIDTFLENLSGYSGGDLPFLMQETIKKANSEIHQISTQKPEMSGMGTTVVACAWCENKAFVANVGDSRCYLLRDDYISQVSIDHSYVQMLVSQGKISAEEARYRKDKNLIMRAVGCEADVDSDIFEFELKSGDIVLLCSDGLSNMVEDEEIKKCLLCDGEIQTNVEKLVEIANNNGGKDNVTVVAVKFVD